jgi:peptidoglycan/LPS O-acetylase OafA/YrhL
MGEAKPSYASTETLYSVQYLRAAAALAVVYYHVSALSQETWGLDPERIDHVGAAGVDLFFVISGFVMAMIVGRPGAFDGREFWVRRIARVVPAYWVITFAVFALAWFMPHLFNSTTADVYTLMTSLSFLALDQGGGNTTPLLVVGWTLNYEIFFYAIVALTAGLFGDRRLHGASLLLIALVVLGLWFVPEDPSLAFYTDPILLEFVFGILIYRTWSGTRQLHHGLALAMFLTGTVLLVLQWERPVGDLTDAVLGRACGCGALRCAGHADLPQSASGTPGRVVLCPLSHPRLCHHALHQTHHLRGNDGRTAVAGALSDHDNLDARRRCRLPHGGRSAALAVA